MNIDAIICAMVLLGVFVGLIRNHAPDVLLLSAVVLVTTLGIISPEEAFAGFANRGMLTVAALYVIAAALQETGAIAMAGSWVLGSAQGQRAGLLRLAAVVTPLSAILNNTPIVAMFIPAVVTWCKQQRMAASRLLLPLSYLCILGGTCTLIGTSTNLVVNGLMEELVRSEPGYSQTLYGMGFFELGRVGLPYAVIGLVYLAWIGQGLLPERHDPLEQHRASSREYLANLKIMSRCPLAGKTVEEAGLRRLSGLFLVEISRSDQIISPVTPDQTLHVNDVLTFTGIVDTLTDLEKTPGLVAVADSTYEVHAVQRRQRRLCEAVISPRCPALGKTIRDADFRALYNAAVVAVHRGGHRLAGRVGDVVLRAGDTLLLQTGPHFAQANRNNPDFLLVGSIPNSRPIRHDKVLLSLLVLGLLVGLMVSRSTPIVVAAFLCAGLMVMLRCISVSDARRSIEWTTLITIAAAFGLSKALLNSGLVAFVAQQVVGVTEALGPYGTLAAVYLMTSVFTEIVTNNAAAALVFPFAVAIADQVGISPRPMVMAVAFAASASFMTPLGYQTNLMVYGPGGYRITDFVKVGLPLNLLLLMAATLLIPLAWPFH